MGALKLVLPSAPHHAPSFKKLTIQNNVNSVKTNLYVQPPLRRPKQTHETAKLQKQPETLNPEPIHGGSSSCRDEMQHAQVDLSTVSDVFRLMDCLSLPVTLDLYSSLIKECTFTRDSRGARDLQAHIVSSGIRPTVSLINRLILMHVSCGHGDFARQLFDKMPKRDFYSWAIVILSHIEAGDYHEAIGLFSTMLNCLESSSKLPAWIISCLLKACVLTGDLGLGKQVHALCLKLGSAGDDLYLSGSLMRFYRKFKCSDEANFVLDQLSCTNPVVWAAKIANDHSQGLFLEAIHDFKTMGSFRIKKNSAVFSGVLKACGRIGDGGKCGKQVHANAIKLGFETESFVQRGLVDMYGRCRLVRDAERVFEEVEDNSNVACWNAMVVGYMRNGFNVEAIRLLYRTKASGMEVPERLFNDLWSWYSES